MILTTTIFLVLVMLMIIWIFLKNYICISLTAVSKCYYSNYIFFKSDHHPRHTITSIKYFFLAGTMKLFILFWFFNFNRFQ